MLGIRLSTASDVDAFEAAMPTHGRRVHAWHFDQQREGVSAHIVAVLDGEPAGSGVLQWAGSGNEQTRAALPAAVEINNLHVRPDRHGRGVGTAITLFAENLARERGHRLVTMAVGIDNPDAARLYDRLGYVDTGRVVVDRYTITDADGIDVEHVEPSRVLVKTLTVDR